MDKSQKNPTSQIGTSTPKSKFEVFFLNFLKVHSFRSLQALHFFFEEDSVLFSGFCFMFLASGFCDFFCCFFCRRGQFHELTKKGLILFRKINDFVFLVKTFLAVDLP
jgi:hypothetical protein